MAPTEPAARTRAAHLGPERRRPLILDAARSIASESGVASVTIGAVAERLDVTRPVVYSCYGDRVELLEALIDREATTLIAASLAALAAARRADLETSFVCGFQAWLEVAATQPDTWHLLTGQPDPAVADVHARARALIADAATAQIRPALAASGVADLDRKMPAVTELFLASCEAAVRSLKADTSWTPTALGEFYGRAMWRAFSGV